MNNLDVLNYIDDSYIFVYVTFNVALVDGDQTPMKSGHIPGEHVYKAHKDSGIIEGDYILVPYSRSLHDLADEENNPSTVGIRLAKVRRIEVDDPIPEEGRYYRWVIGQKDLAKYLACVERDKQLSEAITKSKKRNARQMAIAALGDEYKDLLNHVDTLTLPNGNGSTS